MFYVIEIQEQNDGTGTIVTPIKSTVDKNDAYSKYHETLMYAAISSVYRHTALIVDGEGQYLARETFMHPVEVDDEITS